MVKKIVLAYSGGLDTSVILTWLKENYKAQIVAFVGDIGQGEDELAGIEEKARKTGASEVVIADLRLEFASDFLWPMLRSGATYESRYLLGTSIARPLLAKAQVAAARKTGADALAHGCTGKGNDQVRFERGYAALAPDLKVIAPWREWNLRSREDLLRYAEEHKIPVSQSLKKLYSRDRNLWHISHEGGVLEDPAQAAPEDVWLLTKSPLQAPEKPAFVEVEFEQGNPVGLDGEKLDPVALVERLNRLGGEHGVGRIDLVENRFVGIKSRGAYETPGGTILVEAHQALEQLTLDRQLSHLKQELALRYADLIYDGAWFTSVRETLETFFAKSQETVTGTVRVRLFKGQATAIARKSPHSLYAVDYATFGEEAVYDQKDAGGFIRLVSLPAKIAAARKEQR